MSSWRSDRGRRRESEDAGWAEVLGYYRGVWGGGVRPKAKPFTIVMVWYFYNHNTILALELICNGDAKCKHWRGECTTFVSISERERVGERVESVKRRFSPSTVHCVNASWGTKRPAATLRSSAALSCLLAVPPGDLCHNYLASSFSSLLQFPFRFMFFFQQACK